MHIEFLFPAQQRSVGRPQTWQARVLLTLACLLPLSAAAQSYTVDIVGAGALTSLLENHLDIGRHTSDTDMNADELQRLFAATPKQIRDLLATEGHFSSKVTPTLREAGTGKVAQFVVEPGPATRIGQVDLSFTGAIAKGAKADPARIDALRRAWTLDQGSRFRQADWDAAKSTLLKDLLTRDFPAARIAASSAEIDPQTHTAALSVEIDSGPAFTLGPLQIQGLKRYSRAMIEVMNPLREGDAYSQDKLTELQARLQDSGYFGTVFATIEIDPAHPENVPVRVDVVENPRRRLSLGVGYSTDGGARIQSKWLDRRFLDQDWRLDSQLKFDQKTRLLGGDLTFPARGSGWVPSVGSLVERRDANGEINDQFRLNGRYTSPYKQDEKVWGMALLLDRQRIGDEPVNHRQALVASWGYTRRRLDNLISPTRGHVLGVEVSAGPRGLINEASLLRLYGQASWLKPFGRSDAPRSAGINAWSLELRGQLGQVYGPTRQQVPNELLFRTGGDQSVRGYGFETLGVEQDGAIVAGRVLAVASAELVYQITPTIGAAVFHDAGNAADSWNDFQFRHGSGVGARVRTPIGPVKIDLAYGHTTKKVRLHFSVGYGF